VDDAFGVRRVECVRDLYSNLEKPLDVHGPSTDGVLQCLSGKILHGYEAAVIMFANFVNGADVGVIESRGGARLATEPLQSLRVSGKVVWEEFEGDEAAKLNIFGLVNHTHTAAAELFNDSIVRKRLSDERLGIGHGW
jgi:hypothetical protein